MITWKSANLSSEQVHSSAYPDETLVLDFDDTKPRSSIDGALRCDLCHRPSLGRPRASCNNLHSSASQPSVGTAAFAACDACENTRDDINFPVDFCNPDFPWWYKQEETTLGILRTSSWKVSSGSIDKWLLRIVTFHFYFLNRSSETLFQRLPECKANLSFRNIPFRHLHLNTQCICLKYTGKYLLL